MGTVEVGVVEGGIGGYGLSGTKTYPLHAATPYCTLSHHSISPSLLTPSPLITSSPPSLHHPFYPSLYRRSVALITPISKYLHHITSPCPVPHHPIPSPRHLSSLHHQSPYPSLPSASGFARSDTADDVQQGETDDWPPPAEG